MTKGNNQIATKSGKNSRPIDFIPSTIEKYTQQAIIIIVNAPCITDHTLKLNSDSFMSTLMLNKRIKNKKIRYVDSKIVAIYDESMQSLSDGNTNVRKILNSA